MVTITFGNPQYLWFLLAIPLLIVSHFYLIRYTKRKALLFANFRALKRATGKKFITKNYTILFLRLAIIVFSVLAVSQVSLWYETETNENEYVLAIDTSASMGAQDVQPTRLEAAIAYGERFIDDLDPDTRVALVSFSGITLIESPLTRDHDEVVSVLKDLKIEASGTDIPGALITSTNLLEQVTRGKAVILITDGSNTIETFQSRSMKRAVEYTVSKRVKVFAIGVGSVNGTVGYLPSYYNISSKYNTENLEFIANRTGGAFYEARDTGQLRKAYENILSSETTSLIQRDLTPGLLLLVMLALFVEWGLLNTRFRLLP